MAQDETPVLHADVVGEVFDPLIGGVLQQVHLLVANIEEGHVLIGCFRWCPAVAEAVGVLNDELCSMHCSEPRHLLELFQHRLQCHLEHNPASHVDEPKAHLHEHSFPCLLQTVSATEQN
jgi:hypothetical protein